MTLAVGVDLGGTNLRVALVETNAAPPLPSPATGAAVASPVCAPARQREQRTPLSDTDPVWIADAIAAGVRRATEGIPDGDRLPVGVGIAGMLAGKTGVVANAPNLGWRGVDFRALLRARLPGRRVELYNDVNAIAYGEYAYGAGRGAHDVLAVFVGTGIGAGFVCADRLVEGASNMAGEIGHVKVVVGPGARRCGCGAFGCVEAYVGGLNLQSRAREDLAGRATSRAVALAGGDVRLVHPGHLDQAAREGDAYANALWDEVAPLLGLVLANAVTLLNSGRLVLGGGVLRGAPELKRRVLAHYERTVNGPSGEACVVVDAALGDDAGILGAAALATLPA